MMRRVLFAFGILTAVLLLLGAGGGVRLLLPPITIALGILLFFRARELYVDFVLWCWFLSPFLRRVVDLQAGWKDPSVILLIPYVVALIAPACDWKRLAFGSLRSAAPYIAALVAIAYGTLRGMALQPPQAVISGLLFWAVPILFAWWCASADPFERLQIAQSTRRSFLSGLFLIGAYGILQFVIDPSWDRNWLLQLGTTTDVTSMGVPEPYQIRVFSTLNSAGVCGLFLAAGLLLLTPLRGWRVTLAIACSFGCLMLTQVRSAWLCLLLGLTLMTLWSFKDALKTLAIVALTTAVFSPVLIAGPARDLLQARVSSVTTANDDASLVERRRGLAQAVNLIGESPAGLGIGVKESIIANDGSFSLHDNGFIEAFLSLGWAGGAVFLLSLLALVFAPLDSLRIEEVSARAARIAAAALLTQVAFGSVFLGASGFLLWSFLALAAPCVEQEQSSPTLKQSPSALARPGRRQSSPYAAETTEQQPTLRKI